MDDTARCNCTPVVGTRFGGDRDRPPSITIIEAVAAAEGVVPTELDSVYDTINSDALDSLLADQDDGSICIKFDITGWNVFVRGDGAIRVCDPDLRTEPAPVFDKPLAD